MAANFFQILEISKNISEKFDYCNVRTYTGELFFHIDLGGMELELNTLLNVENDLNELQTSLHSISVNSETGTLILNIYK